MERLLDAGLADAAGDPDDASLPSVPAPPGPSPATPERIRNQQQRRTRRKAVRPMRYNRRGRARGERVGDESVAVETRPLERYEQITGEKVRESIDTS